MLAVDVAVGLAVAAAALAGARLGIRRALPIAGAAAGLLLGSRAPLLAGQQLDSDHALNIAVPAVLVAAAVGAVLGEAVAHRASRRIGRGPAAGLGALLTAAAAAVAVWALAPAVAEVRSVRDDVQRSKVIARFNAVLAPVRPPRSGPAPLAARPRSSRRRRVPAAGDPGVRSRPEVERAERSLVKISVMRCGGGYQGTGWIAGDGIVVTNAHVVSASTRVTVAPDVGRGMPLLARVVWFDGIHDLALLRVGALRREPGLPLAADPRPSTPAVSLGFPMGKLTIRRARLGPTTSRLRLPPVDLDNRAGVSLTIRDRLVTVVRGLSGPGGSGGPVIDGRGRVLGTIFSGIAEMGVTFAVPNRIVRSALERAGHRVDVPSCGDPPLRPTREQQIAARRT